MVMDKTVNIAGPSTAVKQETSVSHEWQGVLDHSYDALDMLVNQFAGHLHAADQFTPTEPVIVGQFDGVLPLSHYML
jgi:hypothetical protein